VTVSAVSSVAARHGSAEFFAPPISIFPLSGRPPRTKNLSICVKRAEASALSFKSFIDARNRYYHRRFQLDIAIEVLLPENQLTE
jgi:hypothetical protein